MRLAKAEARDRKRTRAVHGMRADDSARKVALARRDREWRRARGRASTAVGAA